MSPLVLSGYPLDPTPKKLPTNLHWFEHAWRRAVIDMHIPDWNDAFLSEFDPDNYVEQLVKSRAQSIVLYAQSHVGLFNYPTKVGRQHRGLKGRDVVGDLLTRCHQHNIACILYVSVIHDRWASDQHPEWRIVHPNGGYFGENSRHGFVCPNSPYREYVRDWTHEICQRYDFEGMRFDMTFWTCVCCCMHCRRRWQEEIGGDFPTAVDWTNERWVQFQRKREQWLGEFAAICTTTVKKLKPHITVEHQASTYTGSWNNGVSWPLLEQNDFLQGDFYGDALQGSFVRKLLEDLTPNRPFAYETCFSVNLQDHTARKSEALLEAKASAAIADAAAFVFIDAIDPVGTVNPRTHQRMARVFDRLMPYYSHLGGERVADIGVFYSLDSRFDMSQNGCSLAEVDNGADIHTRTTMQAARWLIAGHLPFRVVTKKSLNSLSQLKILVLSNVHHLDEDEVKTIRKWIQLGGTLYASGATSLVNKRGQRQSDFMLADAFGASLVKADWSNREHYLAPTMAGQELFSDWNVKYPAYLNSPGMIVGAHRTATVLATTTLPWQAPNRRAFSSIHSNPPWQATDQPEVVLNPFGQGRVIYSASLLEDSENLKGSFLALIRKLHQRFVFEIEAHPAIEATLFHQPHRNRYVLSMVNFQRELPNIPVDGIRVKLHLPHNVLSVKLLPNDKEITTIRRNSTVQFISPRLKTLMMFAIHVDE
jgi:hypothetical protein